MTERNVGLLEQATLSQGLPNSLAESFVEPHCSPTLPAQTSCTGTGLKSLSEALPDFSSSPPFYVLLPLNFLHV